MLTQFILPALLSFTLMQAAHADRKCAEASRDTGIDFAVLETCLQGEGVELEVHGAVPMSSLFVVTYRNPRNFFQSVHLSLLVTTPELRSLLRTLKRHDVIMVKGGYARIPAPQKHIRAREITLVSSSPEAPHSREYSYQTLPEEVVSKNHLIGKVHAVYGDGRILVVEDGDLVVPVYVEDQWIAQTAGLSRGDKIELFYVVQEEPTAPVHVNLDPRVAQPLRVLNSVMQDHGRPTTKTGKLLRFPKSPMVNFPVFAIDVDMGDGVLLPHTVLSFTNPELFSQARKLFQDMWDAHPAGVRQYRNKFINDEIEVTVSGTYNMIDPLQANPQIVIDSLDQIKFTTR